MCSCTRALASAADGRASAPPCHHRRNPGQAPRRCPAIRGPGSSSPNARRVRGTCPASGACSHGVPGQGAAAQSVEAMRRNQERQSDQSTRFRSTISVPPASASSNKRSRSRVAVEMSMSPVTAAITTPRSRRAVIASSPSMTNLLSHAARRTQADSPGSHGYSSRELAGGACGPCRTAHPPAGHSRRCSRTAAPPGQWLRASAPAARPLPGSRLGTR